MGHSLDNFFLWGWWVNCPRLDRSAIQLKQGHTQEKFGQKKTFGPEMKRSKTLAISRLHVRPVVAFTSIVAIVNTDFPSSPCTAFTHIGGSQEADFQYLYILRQLKGICKAFRANTSPC